MLHVCKWGGRGQLGVEQMIPKYPVIHLPFIRKRHKTKYSSPNNYKETFNNIIDWPDCFEKKCFMQTGCLRLTTITVIGSMTFQIALQVLYLMPIQLLTITSPPKWREVNSNAFNLGLILKLTKIFFFWTVHLFRIAHLILHTNPMHVLPICNTC